MKKLLTFLIVLLSTAGIARAQDTYCVVGNTASVGEWNLDNAVSMSLDQITNKYTAHFDTFDATEFKIVKNRSWDVNYGFNAYIYMDEYYQLVQNADNLRPYHSFPYVMTDVTLEFDPSTLVFKMYGGHYKVFSLIGYFNDWAGDVDFTRHDDGHYTAFATINGEFKVRVDHEWNENYGNEEYQTLEMNKDYPMVSDGYNYKTDSPNQVMVSFALDADKKPANLRVAPANFLMVGSFCGWQPANGKYLTPQSDGTYTLELDQLTGNFSFYEKTTSGYDRYGMSQETFITIGESYDLVKSGDAYDLNVPSGQTLQNVVVKMKLDSNNKPASVQICTKTPDEDTYSFLYYQHTDLTTHFVKQSDGSYKLHLDELTSPDNNNCFSVWKGSDWDWTNHGYGLPPVSPSDYAAKIDINTSYDLVTGGNGGYGMYFSNAPVTYKDVTITFTPDANGVPKNFMVSSSNAVVKTYGIVGEFNGWDLSNPAYFNKLEDGKTYCLFRDSGLSGEFKIVVNGSWNENYGYNGGTMTVAEKYTLDRNGNNMNYGEVPSAVLYFELDDNGVPVNFQVVQSGNIPDDTYHLLCKENKYVVGVDITTGKPANQFVKQSDGSYKLTMDQLSGTHDNGFFLIGGQWKHSYSVSPANAGDTEANILAGSEYSLIENGVPMVFSGISQVYKKVTVTFTPDANGVPTNFKVSGIPVVDYRIACMDNNYDIYADNSKFQQLDDGSYILKRGSLTTKHDHGFLITTSVWSPVYGHSHSGDAEFEVTPDVPCDLEENAPAVVLAGSTAAMNNVTITFTPDEQGVPKNLKVTGTPVEDLQTTLAIQYGNRRIDLHETQFANEYAATLDYYSGGKLYIQELLNGVEMSSYGIANGSGSTFIQPDRDYTLSGGGWFMYLFDGCEQSQAYDIFIVVRKNSDNTLTFRMSPQGTYTAPTYALVGDFNYWRLEDVKPFTKYVDNNEMEFYGIMDMSSLSGEFKILKWDATVDDGNGNFTWSNALADGGKSMVATPYEQEDVIRYNLYYGDSGQNNGITPNMVVDSPQLWLTIPKNGAQPNLFIQGIMSVQPVYSVSVVGNFCGWDLDNATQMSQTGFKVYEVDIDNFPGGEQFKFSINNTWTCFLANLEPTKMDWNIAHYCDRDNNDNNFSVGETGRYYNVHIRLVLSEDEMTAEATITTEPVKLKLGKFGWASFCHEEDLSFAAAVDENDNPVEVTTYVATQRDGDAVALEKVENGAYRAGEGILVFAEGMEDQEITVPLQNYHGTNDDTYSDNRLRGILVGTLVEGGPTVYRFGYSPTYDKVGFMQSDEDFNLSPGKAYLHLLFMASNFIPLFDGTATGIEGITTDKLDTTAPMYNTSGQRVDSSYRGVVLQNGKKFILK